MQYIPENGIYVYFRYNQEQTLMVAYNSNGEAATLNTARFEQYLSGYSSAYNVGTQQTVNALEQLEIPAHGSVLLELR